MCFLKPKTALSIMTFCFRILTLIKPTNVSTRKTHMHRHLVAENDQNKYPCQHISRNIHFFFCVCDVNLSLLVFQATSPNDHVTTKTFL